IVHFLLCCGLSTMQRASAKIAPHIFKWMWFMYNANCWRKKICADMSRRLVLIPDRTLSSISGGCRCMKPGLRHRSSDQETRIEALATEDALR
ncbi:hypothetical protein L9F63_004195, partial [Diploptera punctata]